MEKEKKKKGYVQNKKVLVQQATSRCFHFQFPAENAENISQQLFSSHENSVL